MVNFGYISTRMEPEAQYWKWLKWLPLEWKYCKGPLHAGEISGITPDGNVRGWAWNVPEQSDQVWGQRQINVCWQKLWVEIYQKQIKIIGLDFAVPLPLPAELKRQPYFPGISDGKALELLLFIGRFRTLLQNHEIPAHRAKVIIVWEEGNLGLTCARLIAREVRFITLVHPHQKLLERAAEIIMAETGVSPRIYSEWPDDYQGAKLLIQCGNLAHYHPAKQDARKVIRCALFQRYPRLSLMNLNYPVSAWHKTRQLPAYPVLGEVILRAVFRHESEFWYGGQLPLERVIKLARIFKEIGADIRI
jgi:hypothetical protein